MEIDVAQLLQTIGELEVTRRALEQRINELTLELLAVTSEPQDDDAPGEP